MKKLILMVLLGFSAIGFVGCNNTTVTQETLSSRDSLATLAYLSGNFLDMNLTEDTQTVSYRLLSDVTTNVDDEIVVEEELEEINQYLDLLKAFMENGATDFAGINDEVSDRLEYDHKLTIIVESESYVLYYSISDVGEITGIFVIGNQEYQIVASNYLDDADEFDNDDDDDDEFDDEDDEDLSFTKLSDITTTEEAITEEATTTEESTTEEAITEEATTEEATTTTEFQETEKKMELTAINGDNYIKITYKQEIEQDETKTEFEMEKNIDGVESEVKIEIKYEQDEYKIEIEDGDNSYEFKREVEKDGIKYELEYEVNGVEGEIEIFETTNEFGETVYQYKIEEEGRQKEVEKEEPWQRGFDDNDDDDDDDETEDTSLIV
jgi:hypothetical protein